MTKKRGFLCLGIAAVLLVTGLLVFQQTGTKKNGFLQIPVPQISMPLQDSETTYEISSTLDFPKEKTVPFYEIELEGAAAVRAKVGNLVGREITENDWTPGAGSEQFYFLEDRQQVFTVDETNGFWTLLESDGNKTGGVQIPGNLPSEEEAIEIARNYITENGLFTGDLGEAELIRSTTGSEATGDEAPLEIGVRFAPPVGGKEVYGLYRITIMIGDNGVITRVFKQASPVKEAGEVQLKSKEEVLKEIRERPEALSSSAVAATATVTDCQLSYYVDGKTVDGKLYVYPVYVLTGEEANETAAQGTKKGADQTTKTFDIVLDAVKRE